MAKIKLNSKKILKEIEDNSEDILKYGVKKIGLFGSFLDGRNKRGSDVDILVSFDEVSFDNYMELKFLLESLFRREVDLVIEKDLKSEIKYVKKEAKYARL